jgi:hypothetical protein
MKKLIAISILLTLLTAAAFAQFGFKITGEFYPDLLKITAPTGDATEPDTDKTGGATPTVPYLGVGTVDFFSASNWPAGPGLSMEFSYKEREYERYGGKFTIALSNMVKRGMGVLQSADLSNTAANLMTVVSSGFGDWELWGKVGIVKGKAGNTGDSGEAGDHEYTDAFNFLSDGVSNGGYGLWVPGTTSKSDAAGNSYTMTNASSLGVFNLQSYPSATIGMPGKPYFQLTADLQSLNVPVKVSLAGDMSRVTDDALTGLGVTAPEMDLSAGMAGLNIADLINSIMGGGGDDPIGPFPYDGNPEGYRKVAAAARVDGSKIADLVSFSVIYKLYGGDFDTEDKRQVTATDPTQPNGDGFTAHSFGLFANLDLLDSLGIGLAYSGFVVSREKNNNVAGVDGDATYRYPYYNGIDLHVNFTGVDKLTINFNNNISFSTIKGSDSTDTITVGINKGSAIGGQQGADYAGLGDSYRSQGYLSLYNALGVKYQISEPMYVNFQVANRLYSYTETWKAEKGRASEYIGKDGSDNFRVGLGAGYKLNDSVELSSGLVFDLASYTHNETNGGVNNFDWGTFTFGIPIYFKVVLP